MKLKFTFLITALLLLGNLTMWGQTSTYEKATSIAVGDQVVLVCEGVTKEMTEWSTTSTVYGIGTEYITTPVGTLTFDVVAGTGTGTYAFINGDNYLYWTSGNSLNKSTSLSAKSSWTVSFDANGNAIILNSSDSGRQIWWNVSSPRFACYTGKSAGSSYYNVQFYKKVASGPTQLTAPTLTGQEGIGSIDYSWSSIDNADSYSLYYTSESVTSIDTTITETTNVTRVTISGSETSYSLTELTPGTSYSAVLVAVPSPSSTSYTRSEASDMVTNTPVSSITLSAPADFSGEAGDQQITFNWTAVENASSYTISYTPEGGNETIVDNVEGTATTYTLTGLTNGTPYSCKIMAVGDETNYISSSYSDAINVIPNLTPTETPTITVNGVGTGTTDEYYVTAQVTINAADGATIYYTTDGNDPTTTSTQYSAPFDVTTTTTVKAIAIEVGHSNSPVTSQTITIVQPTEATFTDGVYSESFTTDLGDWKNITNNTDVSWANGTLNSSSCATINGYQKDSEVWLVSPKITFSNNKMVVNFESSAQYNGPDLELYYSTSYNGYGDIVADQWTKITTASIATATTWILSGDVVLNGTNVYVAFKYTSTPGTGNARAYGIKDFQAKQCYTLTYDANGGSGEMTDANSPYAAGSTVTVSENSFTAPTSQAFDKWNTSADGTGTDYNPLATFTMPAANTTLYAIWGAACTTLPTVEDVVSDTNYLVVSNSPQYNIELLSNILNIGGCNVYDYGFVYSTTNNAPVIDGIDVTKSSVGTSWEETNSFEYTIENVESTTYYVRSYATNNAGTTYSDVVSVVVDAYPTWTITYNNNGSETTENVNQQCSTTLPAPTTTPDGYTFAGWSTSTVDVINTVPTTMVETEYTPSADVTLYAVYAISNVSGNYSWNLVTDATTLAAGDRFMLYGQKSDGTVNKVAGSLTSSYLIAIDVPAPVDNQINQPEGAEIFTLAAGQDGKWVFVSHDGKYLKIGVSYSETLGTEWTIAIDVDGDATISVDSYSLQFNSNNPRFKSYDSNQSYTALYRNTQESVLMNYSTNVTALSGTLTTQSYNTNCYISGATTIPTGVTVTCNYGLSNTNPANLIIEDGGQLIINNSGVQATVQKEIAAWTATENNGWYSISSPVKGLRIDSIFGAPQTEATTTTIDLYSYDEPSFTWKNYHSNSDFESTLIPGKGYLTANEDLTTREFVGELNNGEIIVNLSYASTHEPIRGFNFVGNPYLQDITLGNQATVSESVATGYYKLVGGAFVASDNATTIAPKEGFFVRATADNQTITFNNALTRSKDRANKDQYISIEVNNNTYMDRAYAMFSDVIGLAKVSHLDENAPMVYIPQNGTDYAIASYTDDVNEIPLCFKTPTTGYYTINMKPQGEFNYIHLFDKVENVEIDMLNRGSYEFIGSPKDMENRFTITLNRVNTPNNTVINNFAFISNNELVINNIEGEGTIQIIDIVGRVASQYIVSGSTRISTNELSKGVYMVRLIDNSGSKTQKIVVK